VDGNIGGVFDAYLYYHSPKDYNKWSKHRIIGPLFLRLNRLHVLPMFLLFAVMFSWYFVVSKFLHVFIELLTKCGVFSAQDAGKALAAMRQFNPTFTDEYRKMVPDKWSYRKSKFVPTSRPHLNAKEGWLFSDPDDMGHTYYYKTRPKKPGGSKKKEHMKTWEVVEASGLHSYEVRRNEAYKEVFIAKDALIKAEEQEQEMSLPKETHGEPTEVEPDGQPTANEPTPYEQPTANEPTEGEPDEGAAVSEDAPFDQVDEPKSEPPEITAPLPNDGSAVNEEPFDQQPATQEEVEKEGGGAEEGEEEDPSPDDKESPPPLVHTPVAHDEPEAEASAAPEPQPATSNDEEQPAGVAMAQEDEPPAEAENDDEDGQPASGGGAPSPSPGGGDDAAAQAQEEDRAPPPLRRQIS
jgi:hypothetical protein